MKRTPEEIRRATLGDLFHDVLSGAPTMLTPITIAVREDIENPTTTFVDFSFFESAGKEEKRIEISSAPGLGHLDAIFKACRRHFSGEYPSLLNLRLHGFGIKPISRKSGSPLSSSAQVDVFLRVGIDGYGISEFKSRSHSLLGSCYRSALDAYGFYINCDRCFSKYLIAIEDARSRNRGDIIEQCRLGMSHLTKFNNYEKTRSRRI